MRCFQQYAAIGQIYIQSTIPACLAFPQMFIKYLGPDYLTFGLWLNAKAIQFPVY
jgi:hypothetical protein